MTKRINLLLVLLVVSISFITAQNYPNIVNYRAGGTGRPQYGVKVKTNLPFANAWNGFPHQMPSIKIEGYNYGTGATLNLLLGWYIYNNNFHSMTVSSAGGATPDIWLANEDGKVVIFIDEKTYFGRFTISAYDPVYKSEYYKGWTAVDEELTGTNKMRFNYKNNFRNRVGINTQNPRGGLDVNGTIYANEINTKSLFIDRMEGESDPENSWPCSFLNYSSHNLIIGTKKGVHSHNVIRFEPGGAEKGANYSSLEIFRSPNVTERIRSIKLTAQENADNFINNGGKLGIGTSTPQAMLDVRGKIIADEVQIKVNKGADFVFKPNYKLMPLSEVETFIKENQHLPEIPSEKQMQEEGVGVNEMQIKLLQKIEELTLYTIQLQKQIDKQNMQIKALQK